MSDAVIRLKITLHDTKPPIWRRVEVAAAATLKDLHTVIQTTMGWQNYHLYRFEVGRQAIDGPGFEDAGPFGTSNPGAARVTLDDLVARKVKRFSYLYDMGDDWQHDIVIEKLLPADPAVLCPRYIDGAGRCPPEDVGGIPGFYNFLDALADRKHPDHADLLQWYGGPFDANAIGEDKIRKRLATIAARRLRGALKSTRKH